MKKITFIISLFLLVTLTIPSLSASPKRGGKNLYNLANRKSLTVYLDTFSSTTEKISSDQFKSSVKDFMSARNKETFVFTDTKSDADIYINADLVLFRYLEDDPVDHIVGGLSGLLVDSFVKQNYAQIKANFEVFRTNDDKRIWKYNFTVSVTQTEMPEAESIPKVLLACSKRFIALCFGKPR